MRHKNGPLDYISPRIEVPKKDNEAILMQKVQMMREKLRRQGEMN
jgi:hypothetical protein